MAYRSIKGGIVLASLALSGCESVAFYTQAAQGQAEILFKRTSIESIVADAQVAPEILEKLQYLQAARAFASTHLGLPDNNSYTRYVDLGRSHVVWNVVATSAYDIQPKQHCFPIAGCVTYRGYFSKEDAQHYADQLRGEGLDVVVGGVSAYSTLGWFSDPILSTMLGRPLEDLAGLLFHELAHQQYYRKGDTTFNESFATTVEREGLRAWLRSRNEDALLEAVLARRAKRDEIIELILRHRQKLGDSYMALYQAEGETSVHLSEAKKRGFAALRQDYEALKSKGGGTPGYDRWMKKPLNNASLALFADYNTRVPEFTALLSASGDDWPQFYTAIEGVQ